MEFESIWTRSSGEQLRRASRGGQEALPGQPGDCMLVGPGLRDSGPDSFYRAVFCGEAELVCGFRIPEVGNDFFYGFSSPSQRSDLWERQSVCRSVHSGQIFI